MSELIAGGAALTPEHFNTVRMMKEQMCHVSMDYNNDYYSRDDILDHE